MHHHFIIFYISCAKTHSIIYSKLFTHFVNAIKTGWKMELICDDCTYMWSISDDFLLYTRSVTSTVFRFLCNLLLKTTISSQYSIEPGNWYFHSLLSQSSWWASLLRQFNCSQLIEWRVEFNRNYVAIAVCLLRDFFPFNLSTAIVITAKRLQKGIGDDFNLFSLLPAF